MLYILPIATEENVALKTQVSRLSNDLEHTRRNALAAEELSRCRREELEARLSGLMATEHELRENVQASEVSYSERLKAGEQREKELMERIQSLESEFEVMRIRTERQEQEWAAKLAEERSKQSEVEVVLRSQSLGGDQQEQQHHQSFANASHRHSSPMKSTAENWHVEAESLRSVLDLKMNEVAELRLKNQDLRKAADELTLQQIRTSSLESKVEDLQFQLNGRIERET